jgi:hypothetical protein
MLIEVTCKDVDGQPYYTGSAGSSRSGSDTPLTTELDYVLFGDTIEVRVKADDGTILGDWTARNVYPAAVVTATQFSDGSIAVVDNASNTYTKVSNG